MAMFRLLMLAVVLTYSTPFAWAQESGKSGEEATKATASKRPNLVFIYTDDQAPWALGFSGNKEIATPNIDRLCRDGAYLPNSFTTTPVCSPSRASLLTSRYGTELGIVDWIHPDETSLGLSDTLVTWPEVLSEGGSHTGLVGKWHVGHIPAFHPTQHGYKHFYGFTKGGVPPKNPKLEVDGQEVKAKGFTAHLVTDNAVKFIDEQKDKPFALSIHYREPHAPWLPMPEDVWAKMEGLQPTIPNPDYPDLDTEGVTKRMREYLASVTLVDQCVGKILTALDKAGVADNTIVVFTSDHGYNMGHNGIWHKGNGHWILNSTRHLKGADPARQRPNLYDNSLRVPTAVYWPGVIKPGTVIEETVSNLDWYPTLVAMLGDKLPEGEIIRGRNFLPLLQGTTGTELDWDNDLYAQYSQHHYTTTNLRAYRTPEWKLVRDFLNSGKDELYHLKVDPAENHNLIESKDPEVTRVKEELNQKMIQVMKKIDDPALRSTGKKGNSEVGLRKSAPNPSPNGNVVEDIFRR